MGLKWFRARLTFNRKSKGTREPPEFYRSNSEFNSDLQFSVQQSSVLGENRVVASIHSVPTSPGSLVYNPMAASNSQESETSGAREDNGANAKEKRETNSDEKPDARIGNEPKESTGRERQTYLDEEPDAREDNRPIGRVRSEWRTNTNEELDSPNDFKNISRQLPGDSIELMHDGNTPRQLVITSGKADFKKMKVNAPMSNKTSNGLEDGRRSIPINKGRRSDGSEMEI